MLKNLHQKRIWKCRLQNVGHFVQAFVCYCQMILQTQLNIDIQCQRAKSQWMIQLGIFLAASEDGFLLITLVMDFISAS